MAVTAKPQPDRPRKPTSLPELLSIAEVAHHVGVEVRHVRRLVHERRIPFIRCGHLLRFDPAELAGWIDANRRQPQRPI